MRFPFRSQCKALCKKNLKYSNQFEHNICDKKFIEKKSTVHIMNSCNISLFPNLVQRFGDTNLLPHLNLYIFYYTTGGMDVSLVCGMVVPVGGQLEVRVASVSWLPWFTCLLLVLTGDGFRCFPFLLQHL